MKIVLSVSLNSRVATALVSVIAAGIPLAAGHGGVSSLVPVVAGIACGQLHGPGP